MFKFSDSEQVRFSNLGSQKCIDSVVLLVAVSWTDLDAPMLVWLMVGLFGGFWVRYWVDLDWVKENAPIVYMNINSIM